MLGMTLSGGLTTPEIGVSEAIYSAHSTRRLNPDLITQVGSERRDPLAPLASACGERSEAVQGAATG